MSHNHPSNPLILLFASGLLDGTILLSREALTTMSIRFLISEYQSSGKGNV